MVTFDADFFDILVVKGFPPKIIWLRTGNLTTSAISEYFINNFLKINTFIDDPDKGRLELF
ncbi:MAG: DUF5615 family PIN-like protein [Dysgonamonadaceae bacterium]|nr:DUF5615 family PIN-like protein [Dysgonamonadaceae bacterium]